MQQNKKQSALAIIIGIEEDRSVLYAYIKVSSFARAILIIAE